VFFIDGSSESRYQADLVRYVRALGIEHSQKSFEEALLFISDNASNGERLLIIDNADDPSMNIEGLLPQCDHGAIIITTRNHILGHLAQNGHLELDSMSEDEAIEALTRASLHPWPPVGLVAPEMKRVCSELGYLPIALVQAGSYMAQTVTTPIAYLSKLQESRTTVMKHPAAGQRDMRRYKSAYAAFDASYKALPSKVQKVLQLFGAFHWNRFPVDHIQRAARNGFHRVLFNTFKDANENGPARDFLVDLFLIDGAWNIDKWDATIITLQNYSFLSIVSYSTTTLASMHPVTHMWLNDLSSSLEDQELVQMASIRLLGCWNGEWHSSDRYLVSQAVHHVAREWPMDMKDRATLGRLLHEGGEPYHSLGIWKRMDIEMKRMYGERDEKTISTTSWLATCYSSVGEHKISLELEEDVLRLRKEILGERHPDTIRASANLAGSYSALGQHRQAEQLEQDVLRLRKEILGERHPHTILASANLATSYSALGQHQQAEELQQEVLRLSKEILGERHLDTILASANLASSYSALGQHQQAEQLQQEVLRLRKEILGERHPETIRASANLAKSYSALGHYGQAEQLQQDVLQLRKEILGERHPDTVRASANLAASYSALGHYGLAEQLQQDVLQLRKEILGERHPDTVLASANLCVTYSQLGRHREAEQLARDVLTLRTQVLGETHPDTLSSLYNLAVCQYKLDQHLQAHAHADKAKVSMEKLSYKHPWYDYCVSLLVMIDNELSAST
jgi:tetratricopeptide (TPR) repeat protein